MKLLIGLGNPGEKYVDTRHNLGFMIVDELAEKMDNGQWTMDKKFKSEIFNCQLSTINCMIVKPQTYMNNSGMAVKLLADYYKIPAEDIIVVYDELDLPLGKIKVRIGGSAAGHHGVESIMDVLKTDKFIRVRLGVGNLKTQSAERKGSAVNAEKFVLEPFTHSEKPQVKHLLKQAVKAVELLLEKGLEKAQNQYN
ncbi:aminoacyl-tRNA hydrolase [Patescibacteria group bacterium]|nr:aminoacyl-tRNA hydrolase [Patescibacteria group bacterium]